MMNEINDRLEILIGRLIDGEISPGERLILEREIAANGPAKELLEQLRSLREKGCQAVAAEVSGGASADQIFERAWQQSRKSSYRRIVRIDGYLRFAVGLAAGLILGLALHFVMVSGAKAPIQTAGPVQIAKAAPRPMDVQAAAPQLVGHNVSRPTTGEVDYYVFTSPTGEQWLVEGVREGMVKTADYRGKLRPM
jgi:anti-sigma factor RsiW